MSTASLQVEYTPVDIDELVKALREFVQNAQMPRPADIDWQQRATAMSTELAEKLAIWRDGLDTTQDQFKTAVEDMRTALTAYAADLREHPNAHVLKEKYKGMALRYESLLRAVKEYGDTRSARKHQVRELKPTNYIRNVFHASMASLCIGLYGFVLDRTGALITLASVLAFFGSLEITRKFSTRWNDFLVDKLFGTIARPSERHRVNSATLYLIAVLLITWFLPREAVLAALCVLGYGDPIASIVGKRWGRHKLVANKSLEGTLAFVALSGILAFVCLTWITATPVATAAAVALVAALSGAVTELFSTRVDDNFSIPVVSAVAGWLVLL